MKMKIEEILEEQKLSKYLDLIGLKMVKWLIVYQAIKMIIGMIAISILMLISYIMAQQTINLVLHN